MHKLLLPLVAAVTVAACQDTPTPVGPTDHLRPSMAVGDLSQYFVRADAADVDAAMAEIAANMAVQVAATEVTTASNAECVGLLIGTFDNVTVPAGGTCFLVNSIVRNNVHVLKDALATVDNTQVGNNVIGEGADVIQVRSGSVIGNNFHMDEGGDPVFFTGYLFRSTVMGNVLLRRHNPSRVGVQLSTIGHNLDVKDNTSTDFFNLVIFRNSIGQWAEVSRNTGPGLKRVQFNTTGQRLRCRDNDAPFIGGPNPGGNAEGQCF